MSRIRKRACPSCELEALDLHEPEAAERKRALGVRSAPAVAVDGELARCCEEAGPGMADLEEMDLGRPL